jgi:hypothetical protein
MKPKIASEILFNREGTFQALWAAQGWLEENGYSYGSTCRDMPIGILKGDWLIAKWKNLNKKEIGELDGVLISDDFREGPCKILIYEKQPTTV